MTQTQGKEPVAVETAALRELSSAAAALQLHPVWVTHQAAAKAVEPEHSDLMQAGSWSTVAGLLVAEVWVVAAAAVAAVEAAVAEVGESSATSAVSLYFKSKTLK